MSACTQCGYAARPTDRFCNACGTPLARANTAAPPAPTASPYGAPAPFASPFAPPFAPPAADPYAGGYGGAPPSPYVAPQPSPAQPPFVGLPPAAALGMTEVARDPVPPKALRGFLVAFGANPSGDFWPLTGGRLSVGRFGGADRLDVALQDPTISSRHAAMFVDAAAGTITVEDTGSTNGTFVNDEHIGFNGRRDLRDGDRVRFGAFTTIVKIIGRV
jgi:hypothetical protein